MKKEVVFECPYCGKELLVILRQKDVIRVKQFECEHCKVVNEDQEEFEGIEVPEDKVLDIALVFGVMHYLVKK